MSEIENSISETLLSIAPFGSTQDLGTFFISLLGKLNAVQQGSLLFRSMELRRDKCVLLSTEWGLHLC